MPDNLDLGQLNVKLELILQNMDKGFSQMVTKDLWETWRQGNDQRLLRLEQDHKDWVNESTASHVSLDKDSKARHAEAVKEIEELEVRVNTRLDKEAERNDRIEAEQRSRKNATAKFVIGLVVTSALSVAAIVATIITAVIN
jgi:hypothetical protein